MGFSLFLLLVCPKGFTLPTSSDYSSLTTTYSITNNSTGSTKLRQSPLAFVYTGYYRYDTGSLNDEGSIGYCWSRTTYSGSFAYGLTFGSSGVYPQNNRDRGNGFALRCVGRGGEIIFTDWSSNYSFHNNTDTTIIARLARRPPTLIAATSKHAPRSSGSSFFMLTFYHRSEIYDMMVVMVNK